jgi:hypothetical protein
LAGTITTGNKPAVYFPPPVFARRPIFLDLALALKAQSLALPDSV